MYSKYNKFSPYAYKRNGTVYSHDISVNYDYLINVTEWYDAVKVKNWDSVIFANDKVECR